MVRSSLASSGEQSGNVGADHQIVAIRQASVKRASASARQTSSMGALFRRPALSFVAATEGAGDLRMFTLSADTIKAPGLAEAFAVCP
jgi:hypothetical protein